VCNLDKSKPILMENKSNDATPQRQDGERILNAPLVKMNLYEFIEQIKNETTWKDSDRNSVTIFKSSTMRMVLIGMHENAELKPHKANGVISVHVLEGNINFVTEQQTSLIGKSQMIALRENITHSVLALTETFFLLTLAMNQKQEL
jgi:quercetin dioxygenase-like cupin family protein